MRTLACLLLATLALCGCGKKKAPATAAKETTAAVVQPTLLTESARLGLAARVPADVEFCAASINLRQHVEALTTSQWGQEVKAFLDEKTPASADPGAEEVEVTEAFLSFGKGSAQRITVLRQLNDLYTETAYRGIKSDGVLGSMGTGFNMAKMADAVQEDGQLLETLILLLERFEMPVVMLGMASPEPEKIIQRISQTLRLPEWMGDPPQSRIVTTQAENITVNEITMAEILTVERRQEWMATILKTLPQLTAETRDRIARGLDVLAGKNWVLALGLGKERAYVAVAQKKEEVYLANSAADSMLSRRELRFADGQAQRSGLGLISCWDGAFLDVLQANEPFQPMMRGLLAGFGSEKTSAEAMRRLAPLVEKLGAAERSFFHNEHTSGAAVAWWEGGLRMAWEGGVNASRMQSLAQASRFTPLLDDDAVVFGISGHESGEGLGREYLHAWAKLAYSVVTELMEAGELGEPETQTLKQAETLLLPAVLEVYAGTWAIWERGIGNEGALIVDVAGKMPPLPGLPPGGGALPLPRILLAHELKDRAVIASYWERMQTGLKELSACVPMNLPPVTTQRSGGLTTHAYALPFETADLTPCVSLSNELFMLGTSRRQQQHVVDVLGKNTPLAAGVRMKVNFIKLREFLKAFATVRGQGGADVSQLKKWQRWLEPLDVMETRIWGDNGVARGTLTFGMHDVLSYD